MLRALISQALCCAVQMCMEKAFNRAVEELRPLPSTHWAKLKFQLDGCPLDLCHYWKPFEVG